MSRRDALLQQQQQPWTRWTTSTREAQKEQSAVTPRGEPRDLRYAATRTSATKTQSVIEFGPNIVHSPRRVGAAAYRLTPLDDRYGAPAVAPSGSASARSAPVPPLWTPGQLPPESERAHPVRHESTFRLNYNKGVDDATPVASTRAAADAVLEAQLRLGAAAIARGQPKYTSATKTHSTVPIAMTNAPEPRDVLVSSVRMAYPPREQQPDSAALRANVPGASYHTRTHWEFYPDSGEMRAARRESSNRNAEKAVMRPGALEAAHREPIRPRQNEIMSREHAEFLSSAQVSFPGYNVAALVRQRAAEMVPTYKNTSRVHLGDD